jgi:hypothetical protein
MYKEKTVIVTLTTIPSRLFNILDTLLSIKNQNITADEIVLTLPLVSIREPSSNDPYDKDMIQKIKSETDITILRCFKDYGPATKLLGLLEREKKKNLSPENEALIITLDDDKIYDKDTTRNLLEGWERNKDCVVARKGSIITKLKETNKLYLANKKHYDKINRHHEILLIGNTIGTDNNCSMIFGTGGVLYKASYFKNDIFNYEVNNTNFPHKEMFFTDDIFFSGYLGKNGITKKIIKFDDNETIRVINEKFKNTLQKNKTGVIDFHTKNRHVNPLINHNKETLNDSSKCVMFFEKYLVRNIT